MNRKTFLKTSVLALFAGSFVGLFGEKKFGFIHVNHMPNGLRAGNVLVIDNATGQPIKFNERENWIDDGKQVMIYSIQYANDETGLVGGVYTVYDNWNPQRGLGPVFTTRPFSEIRNISFKIKK